MRRKFVLFAAAASAVLTMLVVTLPAQQALTPREELGRAIYFDTKLSLNENQSCATCHAPEAGCVGAHSMINAAGAV
jgi:cytochrome c peroxidase